MEQFKEKERTIEELALFMKNKTDEKQSLYCMLLGAGASKSSGIRTGQDLVEGWRNIFLQKIDINFNINISVEEKKKILSDNFDWYDSENEYSSLFGKIYDLPNQRRNFIELEVNDKEPSIGYYYLNKLAENDDIQTFFTTNFDDLLEQAFVYNKKRPIVCPHDSSVKNISITSRRTKIIKLHGDFLFTTLRSTQNETQNLKENMRNKFEEFLKNYGLIVLGYAGFDNSIMDVLRDLVKKSDYLNNGVYWCIKKEDFDKKKISPKLIELLKCYKVYYILIDNFDSFCAQLAHLVFDKETISLSDVQQSKLLSRQKFFIEQREIFSDDDNIVNDINDCLSSFPFNDSNNYEIDKEFNSNKEKDNFSVIDDKTLKTPEEIHIFELIRNKEYNKAIEIIDKNINENRILSSQYNKYIKLKIKCLLKLKKRNEALSLIDLLIEYNDKNKKDSNIPLLIQKAEIIPIDSEKIKILEMALSLDCNDITIINFLAEVKTRLLKSNSNLYKSIIDHYDRSISLQPIASNDAYIDKLNFVRNFSNEDKNLKIQNTCNQIICDLKNKDYYSIPVYDAKIELVYQKAQGELEKNVIINDLKKIYTEYYDGNAVYERNDLYLHEYINKLSLLKYNEELENVFDEFDSNNKYNIAYQIQKADVMLCNFRKLDKSISILENIDNSIIETKNKWRKRYYANYLEYLLYKKEYDRICEIVDNEPDSKILANIGAYKEALFIKDRSKYFDIINKDFEESEKLTHDYVTYTYGLLKLEKYNDIYLICQDLFNNQTNSIDINNDVLRINYNLAKKKLKKSITKANLEYIFNQRNDSIEKAAAYVLIDKVEDAKRIIIKEIEKDYNNFYYLQIMPVFENIDFKKLNVSLNNNNNKLL